MSDCQIDGDYYCWGHNREGFECIQASLGELVEALENCDRHVGLLAGERAKLDRAKSLLAHLERARDAAPLYSELQERWAVLAEIPKEKRTPEQTRELAEIARKVIGPLPAVSGPLRELMEKHGMLDEGTKGN